jgi:tetratricopeptide (TPR) repeat protein
MESTKQWDDAKEHWNSASDDAEELKSAEDEIAISRRRFLGIAALSLFVPGSFMAFGLLNRQRPETVQDVASPLSAQRKEMILQEREENRRLRALYQAQKWPEIVTGATTFLEKQESRMIAGMRMEAYFQQQQYTKAIAAYEELFPYAPPDGLNTSPDGVNTSPTLADNAKKTYDMTLLALGRQDNAYRAACQSWIASATIPADAVETGNNIAWAVCLRPNALQDYKSVESFSVDAVDFMRKEVAKPQTQAPNMSRDSGDLRRFVLANYLNTLALVYYRAGKFPEAMKAVQESEGLNTDAANWFLFVKLYKQAGNNAEAELWQNKLKTYFKATYGHDATKAQRYEMLLLTEEMCPDAIKG